MKLLENKKALTAVSAVLAAGIGIGLLGSGNMNAAPETAEVPKTEALASSGDADKLTEILEGSITKNENTDVDKEETVYVIADATGKEDQVIVSDWLKNKGKTGEVKDASSLKDIENVKGDETFSQSNGKLTWESTGDDIYYQGNTDKTVPVGVDISYKLNGTEKTPEEIAGGDGLVTIRVDYKNLTSNTEYVPFMMITGMILDQDKFSSVTVSGGDVISDGNRYIVIGMGMPGIKDALGLTDTDLNIEVPDHFEVTANVDDFELGMTMTVATCKEMNRISKNADVDEVADYIDDMADEYSSGMEALKSGIEKYTDGVGKVTEGAEELSGGTKKLREGGEDLKDGTDKVAAGTKALETGLYQMSAGADTLRTIGNTKLVIGAKQLSQGVTALNTEVQKLSLDGLTVEDRELTPAEKAALSQQIADKGAAYAKASGAGIDSNTVAAKLTDGLKTDQTAIQQDAAAKGAEAGKTAGAGYADTATTTAAKLVAEMSKKYGVTFPDGAQQAAIASITQELAAAYGSGYGNGYGTGYGTAYGTVLQTVSFNVSGDNNPNSVSVYLNNGIAKLCEAYGTAGAEVGKTATMSEVKTKVEAAKTEYQPKIDALQKNMALLDTKTADLATGIETYNSNLSTLADNLAMVSGKSTELREGTDALASGAGKLSDGIGALDSGADKLKTGAETLDANSDALKDGAGKLSDATETIDQKLNDSGKDIKDIASNIDKISDAGRNYQSFAGKSDDMTGSVKFIIRTGAVEAE